MFCLIFMLCSYDMEADNFNQWSELSCRASFRTSCFKMARFDQVMGSEQLECSGKAFNTPSSLIQCESPLYLQDKVLPPLGSISGLPPCILSNFFALYALRR
jgi:hypothetical protein